MLKDAAARLRPRGLRRGSLRSLRSIRAMPACQAVAREASEGWWGRQDSNLRSHEAADLQSAPFATRDTPPEPSRPRLWYGTQNPAHGATHAICGGAVYGHRAAGSQWKWPREGRPDDHHIICRSNAFSACIPQCAELGLQPALEHAERAIAPRGRRMHEPIAARRGGDRERTTDRALPLALGDE